MQIPLLDDLRQTLRERKMSRLLDGAIKENTNVLHEVLSEPIFQESFGPTGSKKAQIAASASAMASAMLAARRKKTEKLYKYLTQPIRRPIFEKSSRNSNTSKSTIVTNQIDYTKVDDYYKMESYFSRSVERQIETLMRNGYDFVTDDPEMYQVVHRDLAYMQWAAGKSLNQTISAMAKNLLKHGFVMVEKQKKRKEMPFEQADGSTLGKRTPKLSNVRIISPLNLQYYVDPNGFIVGVTEQGSQPWKSSQSAGGGSGPGILRRDMAIGFISDPGDDLFPDPPCWQILNDIMTLRSLEETVELIGYQFGSPMLHNKVGTLEEPAGQGEVQELHNAIVSMAPNGMISTDHRVAIAAVKIQENIPDLMPAIDHFKTRVMIGAGSSSLSTGESGTANRATGESLDDALIDRCKLVASVIEDMFTYSIIPDILISNGYIEDEFFTEDGDMKVKMVFHEMKLEKEIQKINSIIVQWQGNLLSFEEARKEMMKVPVVDPSRLYVNVVQIPLAQAALVDVNGNPIIKQTPQATTTPAGGNGKTAPAAAKPAAAGTIAKPAGGTGSPQATTTPQNQHGTKAAPGSRKN